jgi:hypothetical protein
VITSTLLTLVVVPVAYTYLDNLGKRATRWVKRGHTGAGGRAAGGTSAHGQERGGGISATRRPA